MKDIVKVAVPAVAALLALAPLVFAQVPQPVPPPTTPPPIESVGGFFTFINVVVQWVARLFWFVAVIFIFYAGFLYLTAAGNTEKIQKANHTLIYAVIAIVVGLFAFGLPRLIQNVLQRQ